MIKVIFWDIDGTLTDDYIHKAKHLALATRAGYTITSAESMLLNGVNDHQTYLYLCQKSPSFAAYFPQVENYVNACQDFFEKHALDATSDYRIKARVGAIDCLHALHHLNLQQACVTSAPQWQASRNIAALGIEAKLVFIQQLDANLRPKPEPDLYQAAYAKMHKLLPQLQLSEVLVIEDSVSGVRAAVAAGFKVIHCRMNAAAPIAEETEYRAFNYEQVSAILHKHFNLDIRDSFAPKIINLQHSLLFQPKLSLPSQHHDHDHEHYCGFKPGFLLAKRF